MRAITFRAAALVVALLGLFAMHGLTAANAAECHNAASSVSAGVATSRAEHEAHGHKMTSKPTVTVTTAGIGAASETHSSMLGLCLAILTGFVLLFFTRRCAVALRRGPHTDASLRFRALGRGPPDVELARLCLLRN